MTARMANSISPIEMESCCFTQALVSGAACHCVDDGFPSSEANVNEWQVRTRVPKIVSA